MQSVISRAAVRSFAGLVKALVLPRSAHGLRGARVGGRPPKVVEVLTCTATAAALKWAFRGRVWVIGHSLKCPAFNGQTV